ncbi:DUF992 domain-containing protein [Microvirga terricola]|uniref:DUF992 domain-containing protein n=1 Tax=Microvirga terricola TaxID=2719797 RepID=A0ABX0VC83_9HYPH|nr:DUF992 domain-containing protein [Microvirga terricola]NIX76305.1 DUF992 domain-containing protein [Microvirga terricola]
MLRTSTALVALALAASFGITSAQAQTRTRVGMLTCNVSSGVGLIVTSQKGAACTFQPRRGYPEHYLGVIRKYGLDIGGTSRGVLAWAVFAHGSPFPGSLAGNYVGATVEATVGAGLGTNVLVGGSNQSVALQPISVTGQNGLNLAVGVGDFVLRAAP